MKKIFLFVIMIFAISFSVSAWHCVDTDEAIPQGPPFGQWGDNGLLGGETYGWYEVGVTLPEGCTITGDYQAECADTCDGLTLREFLCEDRPNYWEETVITWHDYPESAECSEEIPEFGLLGAALVIAGAAGFLIFRRK